MFDDREHDQQRGAGDQQAQDERRAETGSWTVDQPRRQRAESGDDQRSTAVVDVLHALRRATHCCLSTA